MPFLDLVAARGRNVCTESELQKQYRSLIENGLDKAVAHKLATIYGAGEYLNSIKHELKKKWWPA